MNYLEVLNKLEPVVRHAGEITMRYLQSDKRIEYKDRVNLVTRADHESEEYLFNSLSEVFPEDSIIAEEGHQKTGSSGYTWIVDPLDYNELRSWISFFLYLCGSC